MTRQYTKDAWTPKELIQHMRTRGWVGMRESGMYRHKKTDKVVNLHAVENGRMLWTRYAETRTTPEARR